MRWVVVCIVIIFIILYYCNKKSNEFTHYNGEIFKTPILTPQGVIDIGDFSGKKCSSNIDCENLACGRLSAADGVDKYCCPYGSGVGVDTYGGYDYCYDMPENAVCFSDSMCMDGYECVKPETKVPPSGEINCQSSTQEYGDNCPLYYLLAGIEKEIGGITKKGQCLPKNKKKVGDECITDFGNDGKQNVDGCPYACGKQTFESPNTTCCEKGRNTIDAICDNIDVGKKCDDGSSTRNHDKLCVSGVCEGDYCIPMLKIGDSCTKNHQCPNGCGRNGNSTSPLICCKSGTKNVDGLDYCIGGYLDSGENCRSDDQCKSGNCEGNERVPGLPGTSDGKCSGLRKVGSLCESNDQCQHGCARNGSSDAPLQCCQTDYKTVLGRDYCIGNHLESGVDCRSDDQCKSGNCGGNHNGFNDGICN
jgi:hypothetical protein